MLRRLPHFRSAGLERHGIEITWATTAMHMRTAMITRKERRKNKKDGLVKWHVRVLFFVLLTIGFRAFGEDQTWLFAVRSTATVQTSPPQITLTWEDDPYGVTSFKIYRKTKAGTSWGNPIATFNGATLTYTDFDV